MKQSFNRYLYGGLVILSAITVVVGDWLVALSNMGVALAFDPFDQEQPWGQRPMWQRTWLIIHLAIVAGMAGYYFGFSDK